MTDEINQENLQEQQPISLNEVLEEKVNFFSLPKEEKQRLQNEYYQTLPEEDREEFRSNGYTPKQMFGGKDRYGNDVAWKTPEEFKRDVIEPKKRRNYTNELSNTKEALSKVQSELEHMKRLMELQTNHSLESRERELQNKIEEARYNGDFDAYDKLKQQQLDLSKQKVSLENQIPSTQEGPQYTKEEIRAIESFSEEHKEFRDFLKSNLELREVFDDNVKLIIKTPRYKNLSPKEILDMAKRQTEVLYPEFGAKPKVNVFTNNQYSSQSTPSIAKKNEPNKISYKYENLDYFSRKMIDGALSQYPGKTPQQVLDILSAGHSKR